MVPKYLLEPALQGDTISQMAVADYLREEGHDECIAQEAFFHKIIRYVISGDGIGSGTGDGIGSGRGSGSGYINFVKSSGVIMEVGNRYLVHCGDWHTIVGKVIAQIGPATYKMEYVSKVVNTNNGDCWEELAAGNEEARKEATYKHYKVVAIVPLSILAFEWVGLLPQEQEQQ